MEGRAGRKRWKVKQGGRGGRKSREEEVEGRAGRKRWKEEQGGRGGRKSREEEVESRAGSSDGQTP